MYLKVKYLKVKYITLQHFQGFRMMAIPRTSPMATTKEVLSVYLDSDLKEDLAQMAKSEERSMAYVAAKAIEKAVRDWKASQQK